MGHIANVPWHSSNVPQSQGRIVAIATPLRMDTGHPITAQAATKDGFPSVASYSSLGRRLHYSFPMKHGGRGVRTHRPPYKRPWSFLPWQGDKYSRKQTRQTRHFGIAIFSFLLLFVCTNCLLFSSIFHSILCSLHCPQTCFTWESEFSLRFFWFWLFLWVHRHIQ